MNWPKWIIASLTLFISATVAFRDGDVRLAGSDRYGEGRVEVFFTGAWGTICQIGWDLNDAQVICRQLGFENGAQRTFIAARFGEGSGSVLLSDVECRGDEETLTQCNNTAWNANTCNHQGDVGVRCNAPNYEGCFPSAQPDTFSRTISGTLTFEGCYSYCSTQYLWMQGGDTCVCGNMVSGVTSDTGGCSTPCTGDDWICGGSDKASVYSARVNPPFAGSSGFPGRVTDNSPRDTWRFSPQGDYDYIYIQVHLFDIHSTNATDLVINSDMFEVIDGSPAGVYLVSTTATVIEVTYPGTSRDEGGYLGFLFQFGQGTFCTLPQGLPNGIISTTSGAPFTVGDYFRVTCEAGFRAFDRDVFCQADGTLSRPLSCTSQTQSPTAETLMPDGPPPPTVITSAPPPENVTRLLEVTCNPIYEPVNATATCQSDGKFFPVPECQRDETLFIIPRVICEVPVVENGRVNATAIRVMLEVGGVLEVTCNPIYEPVNATATCQSDGKFFPVPECQRDETLFIILIVIIGVVSLLVVLLLVLLVGCACYFRIRKRRRVRGYQRRNTIEVLPPYGTSTNHGFEMTEDNDSDDDDDSIGELPTIGVPPPPSGVPPPPGGGPPPPTTAPPDYPSVIGGGGATWEGATGGGPPNSGIGEEEATALQGLDDVVDNLERDQLYRSVVKPTITASGGFGGHFART